MHRAERRPPYPTLRRPEGHVGHVQSPGHPVSLTTSSAERMRGVLVAVPTRSVCAKNRPGVVTTCWRLLQSVRVRGRPSGG
jgi:hypothetical protein